MAESKSNLNGVTTGGGSTNNNNNNNEQSSNNSNNKDGNNNNNNVKKKSTGRRGGTKRRLKQEKRIKNGKNLPIKTKMTKDERREKYTNIARQRQDDRKVKDLICYNCRQRGHRINDCPNNAPNSGGSGVGEQQQQQRKSHSTAAGATAAGGGICYKCGSTEHALASCPQHVNGIVDNMNLPYATCFICKQQGHIAVYCQQNQHGVYISGTGCCNICQSKFHRATNCPEKDSAKKSKQRKDDENNTSK